MTRAKEDGLVAGSRDKVNTSFTGMIVVHIETHRQEQLKNWLDGLV